MRPTIRLRMTLLYAVVFFVAGALLLSVSYALVRNNLTGTSSLRGLSPGDYALHEAVQREVADDALGKLRTQYAIALAALTGLSVLLGWAVAGRVLRPLQRITATAQRVSQDNLGERIGLHGPRDELKELADTFDGMLERLSGAFASQRRFVANASHELRTPLSVIRTEVDVTLADPDATTARAGWSRSARSASARTAWSRCATTATSSRPRRWHPSSSRSSAWTAARGATAPASACRSCARLPRHTADRWNWRRGRAEGWS